MRIAVSDSGNEGKQRKYLDWIQSYAPEAELTVVGYKNSLSSLKGFDGLVLTGGEDVDPQLSKAFPVEFVQPSDRKRDEFEFQLLEGAISEKKPILGICRGLQVTNVFLGGNLVADLVSSGFADHTTKQNEHELRHSIILEKDSFLSSMTGREFGEINSFHHQAVLNVADDLMVSGRSSDGVVESLEWKNKGNKSFLVLVQWHPERMSDIENPFTKNICTAFCTAVRHYQSTT